MAGSRNGGTKFFSEVKSSIHKFLSRGRVRGFLELALTLGVLYFFFNGIMTMALRTDSYWMAVVSQSMKHDGDDWRQYYVNNGFDPSNFPIQGGFERGDLLIVQGVGSFSEIGIGDVVVLDMGTGTMPLVHRVVAIWEENGSARFTTKGDANKSILAVEKSNRPEQIIGKVIFVFPKIGYIGLWFQGQ
jgi:hypothetical protein